MSACEYVFVRARAHVCVCVPRVCTWYVLRPASRLATQCTLLNLTFHTCVRVFTAYQKTWGSWITAAYVTSHDLEMVVQWNEPVPLGHSS